jgi:pyruvate/2-oxoglutarate dehydrogenase complex dihydrolipoamide acyltransferase (E2) component
MVQVRGDAVAPGENLCEIETDKVTVEVPAIAAGDAAAPSMSKLARSLQSAR